MDMESGSDRLLLTGRFADQKLTITRFCITLSIDCPFSDSEYSISRVRASRKDTMDVTILIPMLKPKRRKLMTVITNMAAMARLENPLRL